MNRKKEREAYRERWIEREQEERKREGWVDGREKKWMKMKR